MRYRLHTLLMVLAVGPPVLGGLGWLWLNESFVLMLGGVALGLVGLFVLWMIA